MVEFLIQSGANLLAQAHNGKTALQLSQEENQHECTTILLAATSKVNSVTTGGFFLKSEIINTHDVMQHSEQPMYRISALEGQLRMCQDKLVQAHHQHDELMKNERSRHEERIANLKTEFGGKLEEASQTISSLKKKVVELERCLEKAVAKSPPDIRVDNPTPPAEGSPATTRRRKHKRKSEVNSREVEVSAKTLSPEDSNIRSSQLQKSASITDLSSVGNNLEDRDGRRNGASTSLKDSPEIKRSPEVNGKITTQRRLSYAERTSITTLVEESLRNPGSIAAIRKQLKSDGLTPKIQRKFPMKPNTPTTLPSMSPKNGANKESSPLAKESNKA